jgi:hypothetical protein
LPSANLTGNFHDFSQYLHINAVILRPVGLNCLLQVPFYLLFTNLGTTDTVRSQRVRASKINHEKISESNSALLSKSRHLIMFVRNCYINIGLSCGLKIRVTRDLPSG